MIGRFAPGQPDRLLGLGSSEAAAAVGRSRYRGGGQYMLAMVKKRLDDGPATTWDMLRGVAMEPLILDWYERSAGVKLHRQHECIEPESIIRHRQDPSEPLIYSHLDGLVLGASGGRGGLNVEAKSVNGRMRQYWGEPGTDDVDPEYDFQVRHQMACSGCGQTDIAVSFGGQSPEVFTVVRDREREAALIDGERQFWRRYVAGDELPPPDGSEEATEWLSTLWNPDAIRRAKREEEMIEASESMEATIERRMELNETIEELLEEKAEIDNWIRLMIGPSSGFKGDFGRVTWFPNKNGTRVLRYPRD